MRICNQCGAELDNYEDFCPECGAPVDQEPEEYFDEPDDHLKTCPQCGEYVSLDSGVCPSCGYVFYKKLNKKLYAIIGGCVALVAVIAVVLILVLGNKQPDIPVVSQATAEPITIITQEPAVDITAEPTVAVTEAPVPQETESDVLGSHKEEAMTVFNLLEPAPEGVQSVVITAVDGQAKAVGTATAENYITKLLQLAFGKAGFEYNFYLADGSTWRLVMSGTLNDEQIQKMMEMDDELIYATFRNKYLNDARAIITQATGSQPTIMFSVYAKGKSDDDYSLRLVETQPGNGTISRAS